MIKMHDLPFSKRNKSGAPLPEKHDAGREPQEFPDAHPPGLRPATRWTMQTRGPKRGPGFRGIEIAGDRWLCGF